MHNQRPKYAELSPQGICVIVDSRHASRTKTKEAVAKTFLFEEIMEAYSLSLGLRLMKRIKASACLLGPSITGQKAAEFFAELSEIYSHHDCAFLGICDPDRRDLGMPHEDGLHGTILLPFSEEDFLEFIVESVVRAQPESPWAEMYREQHADDKEPETQESLSLASVFSSAAGDMQQLVRGIRNGRYGLNRYGEVDDATDKAIRRICTNLVKNVEIPEHAFDLSDFLIDCFRMWVTEHICVSQILASAHFRQRLKDYVKKVRTRATEAQQLSEDSR